MTFTCHGSHIVATRWELDLYAEKDALQITFTSSQPVGSQETVYMDMISANLSEVTGKNDNGSSVDMTTTLTITAHRLPNKTNITCLTPTEENVITKSSSIFYFAGLLHS